PGPTVALLVCELAEAWLPLDASLPPLPALDVPLPPPPPPPAPPASPMITLVEPSTKRPTVPQCFAGSFRRYAARPLMKTVGAPGMGTHMFGPQHAAWMPTSWMRSAGRLLMLTLGEPTIAGPTHECGQAGQPWASPLTLARSPSR